jgi:ornithine carbamoyltransferase
MKFKGRDFLTLLDFTPEEIEALVNQAGHLKALKRAGVPHRYCEGKNIVLIFEKTSTRTRCSFEVAAHDLGMGCTFLDVSSSQVGTKESIADSARVLGRMYDGIEYRGFGQEIVEDLAKYSPAPVWNGLTNEYHPTQIIADLLTVKEQFGKLRGIKLVYLGDARYNMGNSLMIGCAKMGMHFVAASPKEYFPEEHLIEKCKEIAAETGAILEFIEDPKAAVVDADVLYTDVWVSMGEPTEVWEKRIWQMLPYQVDSEKMALAKPGAKFMHCLPAYHDKKTRVGKNICDTFGLNELEVTNEVFESEASVVFEEAENRMHAIKAIMMATLLDVDIADL